MKEDTLEIQLLNSVYDDINNQKVDSALKKIENYINNEYKDTDAVYLANDMEIEIFKKYISSEFDLLAGNLPLKDIFYVYGFLLIEKNQIDDAENALIKSLKYNPLSVMTLFELIEICKIKRNYGSYKIYLDDVFNYAYSPQDLSRAYRYLGFFHIEMNSLELAAALYIYSLKFDENPAAMQELDYLKHMGQNVDLNYDEVTGILNKNNIPLSGNKFIVDTFIQWGDELVEKESFEDALMMYGSAYSLDDSLENQMRYKMAESLVNGEDTITLNL